MVKRLIGARRKLVWTIETRCHNRSDLAGLAILVVWAFFSLANVGSHRTYEGLSVLVFIGTVFLLVGLLATRSALAVPDVPVGALPVAVLVVGSVVVFQPTYLTPHDALLVRMTVLACSAAMCLLWVVGRPGTAGASLALSAVVLAVTAWFPIRGVPVPGNDVWFMLQQSIEGLSRENMYRMTWTGVPPGQATDAFTYLPMSSVLLAPAKWLTGDARWGLSLAVLLSSVLLLMAARPSRTESGPTGLWFAPACLLPLTSGHPLQVEMAWTEPLLLLLILGAVFATMRKRQWVAVILLALALASKQHVWILLPLFALWRPLGARRTALSLLGGVSLCLPWVLADPVAIFSDTVRFHVEHPANDRSSTVYALLDRSGMGLPVLLAALAMLATVLWCSVRLRRSDAGPAELCLCAALTLLVASLVNKQAYYNQWWLVGSLMLSAVAFARPAPTRKDSSSAA